MSPLRALRLLLGVLLGGVWLWDLPFVIEMFGQPLYPLGRVASALAGLGRDDVVTVVYGAVVVSAAALAFSPFGRASAVAYFVSETLLLEFNGAVRSPELPMVRLLLVAIALLPAEPTAAMLRGASGYGWLVVAGGTFSAGATKVLGGDDAWTSGHALTTLLGESVWTRAWCERLVVPRILDVSLTVGSLALEVLAPLVVLRSVRPWWWISSTCMHLGALCLLTLPQVSLGMLWCHAFLFAVDVELRGRPPFSR
jgi:hypothetical protein